MAVWGFCVLLALWAGPNGGDLVLEQVAGRAVLHSDPYLPLNELGGPEIADWPAPRTPAALALDVPLSLFDTPFLIIAFTVINVSAFVLIVALSSQTRAAMLLCPLILASEVGGQLVRTTNLSPLISLGIVGTWYLARKGDDWRYGIPLGVAAALRIYPAVFALPLLFGRRKVGATALGISVVLNLVGLLIPSITLEGTFRALAAARQQFLAFSNVSLSGVVGELWIAVALLLALAIWLLWRKPDWPRGMTITAPMLFLAGPVTWPHYLLAAGPAIAQSRMVLLIVGLWYLPLFGLPIGLPVLASLLVLLVDLAQRHQVFRRHTAAGLGEQQPLSRLTRRR